MRIVVTGANGAVGKRICKLLSTRLQDVLTTLELSDIVVPSEFHAGLMTWQHLDVGGDLQAVREVFRGASAVLHLGASVGATKTFEEVLGPNIIGMHNVLEACRLESVQRLVVASSAHVVGFYAVDAIESPLLAEHQQLRPDSEYAVSKVFGEAACSMYADKYGMDIVSVRIGYLGDDPTELEQVRRLHSFVSARDLTDLLARALTHENVKGHVVCYGTSQSQATGALFDDSTARQVLGYQPEDRASLRHCSVGGEDNSQPDDAVERKPELALVGGTFAAAGFQGDLSRLLPPNPKFTALTQPPPSVTPVEQEALEILARHHVDRYLGFLEGDPLESLVDPRYRWTLAFQSLEQIASELPQLLAAAPNVVRSRVRNQLEKLDVGQLAMHPGGQRRAQRRAMLLLSMITQAFIWCDPESPANSLPANLAVPLKGVADALGLPPILTHSSYVLSNWRRLDPASDPKTPNLANLCELLGGLDERWFVLATVDVEYLGGRSMLPAALCRLASSSDCQVEMGQRVAVIAESLKAIRSALDGMTQAVSSLTKKCAPYIFYNRVRPFLAGSRGNPALNSVRYEGVDDETPMQLYGGSAAQSTLLPVFDSLFGVQVTDSAASHFLTAMRKYMPREHRRFAKWFDGCKLKEFVETVPESYRNDLQGLFSECVGQLVRFRNVHIATVRVYILAQQAPQQTDSNGDTRSLADNAGGKGTGGTGILDFLKPLRDATKAATIALPSRVEQ